MRNWGRDGADPDETNQRRMTVAFPGIDVKLQKIAPLQRLRLKSTSSASPADRSISARIVWPKFSLRHHVTFVLVTWHAALNACLSQVMSAGLAHGEPAQLERLLFEFPAHDGLAVVGRR